MGIRFFRGQKIRFEHEYRQVREIVNLLGKEFQKEPVYVLTNILVANRQLDCVLLTRSGPLILELKAFTGTVRGLENGPWEVITNDGAIPLANLFAQAKAERQDFIDRLIPIYRKYLPHINETSLRKMGAWIYFCKGSSYQDGQIDFRRVKWFRVLTADTLLDAMRFQESGYSLRIQDMDAIVGALHLEEYEFDTERPVPAASQKKPGRFTLSRRTMIAITFALLACMVIMLLLLVPGAKGALVSAVQGFIAVAGNLLKEGSRNLIKSESTEENAREGMQYLNEMRVLWGLEAVPFDERAYQLARARAVDMAAFGYLDYRNPDTGLTANSIKGEFGIDPSDLVIESAYGQWNGYSPGIEKDAIEAWVSDEGNRNRLFSHVDGAAISCSHGYCSFIGILPINESLPTPGSPLFVEDSGTPGTNATPGPA